MKLIDNIKGLFAAKANQPPRLQSWATTSSWITGLGAGRNALRLYGDEPYGWSDAATYNVWAGNCVSAIADAVALTPLKLYKKAAKKEDAPECVEDHPILELLQTINPFYMDEASFKRAGMEQLNVFGQWLIYKLRPESGGEPQELHILPAIQVDMLRDPRGYPTAYKYLGTDTYAIEDVIRIYYPSLRDPFVSTSPTSRAVAAINRYALADMAQEAIDRNGGKGGGIVGADFNMIDQDAAQFMAQWNAKNRDTEYMADDRFMPQGMTYASGQLTAVEQQREQRSMRLMNEIMAAYGVPPAVAGDYSDASKLANADAQMKQFWRGKIVPLAQMVAESFNNYLLWSDYEGSKEEGLYLQFCFDDVEALQEDEVKRAEINSVEAQTAVAELQGGIITINEAREKRGLMKIKNNPAADDVTLIVNGGQPDQPAQPEQTTNADGEIVDPATASPLTSTQLVNLRGVAESYAQGNLTDRQARVMLRLTAPTISDSDVEDFIAKDTDETINIKETQDAPTEPAQPEAAKPNSSGMIQARVIAGQYRKGDIDLEQAQTMIRMSMPDIDDPTLEVLLRKPAPEPAEQEQPETETEDEEDMGITPDMLGALQTIVDNFNGGLISEGQAYAMVKLLLPCALPSYVAGLLKPPDIDGEDEPLDMEDAEMEAEAEAVEREVLAALDAAAIAEREADDEEDETEDEADGEGETDSEDPAAKAGNEKRDQGGKFSSVDGAAIDRKSKAELDDAKRQAIIDRAMKNAAGKKKGKGKKAKKPKKTDTEKAAEKEKKRKEKLNKAVEQRSTIDDALKRLEGVDTPEAQAAREKLDRAATTIDKQIKRLNQSSPTNQVADAVSSANSAATAAGKALIPLFDWVGCKAFAMDGAELGVIEKVERFVDPKNPRPIEPTKTNPIVSVAGEWRYAADVRVMLEG